MEHSEDIKRTKYGTTETLQKQTSSPPKAHGKMCYGLMKPRLNFLAIISKGMFGKKTTLHITQRTPYPQQSMVVAASCFGAASAGTGALVRVEGIMNSSKDQAILAQNLQASVRKLKMKKKFTFQHDNDPKHTSKSTKAWLHQKKINVLE
uniref:Tc1-like transposase DDE domain-containing protein n=1 Tax=Esox lucius TaxID=8010 RepID=A0AAY5KK39_ESOLU